MLVEREKRLNDLGFVWDAITEAWEYGFSKLLQFKEAKGHCVVPRNCELEGYKLGVWANSQRLKKDSITTERKQRLDDIGFSLDPYEAAWEKGFSRLLQFKEAEGHCEVTKRFQVEGFRLGQWVISQRVRKSYLPIERKQRLDDIGFVWDVSKDKT